jgi:hypothetical protein
MSLYGLQQSVPLLWWLGDTNGRMRIVLQSSRRSQYEWQAPDLLYPTRHHVELTTHCQLRGNFWCRHKPTKAQVNNDRPTAGVALCTLPSLFHCQVLCVLRSGSGPSNYGSHERKCRVQIHVENYISLVCLLCRNRSSEEHELLNDAWLRIMSPHT